MAVTPIDSLPNVDPEAFHLRDKMQELLETLVSVYDSYGVPLPARRYWSLNRPAEDCPQVVVSFIQIYLGAPGDQAAVPQKCNAPRTAVIDITITREYPIGESGKAVNPDRIIAASEWGAVDSWILSESLKQFDNWGDGIPGPGVIATIETNQPRGALQTVRMNLSVVVP